MPSLPSFVSERLNPTIIRGDRRRFNPKINFQEIVPESGVLFLDGGGTLSAECWLVTANLRVVIDMSWYRSRGDMLGFKIRSVPKIERVTRRAGSCLDLGSNGSASNYAHWLFESVGRLAVLDAAGYSHDDFDFIRMPTPNIKRCHEILKLLGIQRNKIVRPRSPGELLSFDLIVKPSIPGLPKQFHPDLCGFLNRNAKRLGGDGYDKVFLRRRARARRLRNGGEVEALLKSRGFRILDPSIDHDANFSDASVLISPHQAGFADLVFCRPGTRILEILPSDMQSQYYFSAAMISGLGYECIIGESDRHRRAKAIGVSPYDYKVDLRVLGDFLDSL